MTTTFSVEGIEPGNFYPGCWISFGNAREQRFFRLRMRLEWLWRNLPLTFGWMRLRDVYQIDQVVSDTEITLY